MTFIQHSLMETQQASLVSPVKQSDSGGGFDSMLDGVVLNEASHIAPQTLDLNNLIEGNADNLPKLESDICILAQELPMHLMEVMRREAEQAEQIQSAPVNLIYENFPKETSE
ncbi:MAG: hypothetical protein Q8Q56_03180, partial [Alphaproteobacteria bacterium]|nr:hypothetical protein [Alphaproteobacteria bacterium]